MPFWMQMPMQNRTEYQMQHSMQELQTLPIKTDVLDEAIRHMGAEELIILDGLKVKLKS